MPDAPIEHSPGAMARVKAALRWHPSALDYARWGPRFRRRFAALTRAMRSRISGIYRSVGEMTSARKTACDGSGHYSRDLTVSQLDEMKNCWCVRFNVGAEPRRSVSWAPSAPC